MASNELVQRRRILLIIALCCVVSLAAMVIAKLLLLGIAFFTNLFYYQTISLKEASPIGNTLGVWSIFIPALGGLIVGIMAKYGSAAIRGHGIPEAMENILQKDSRIPRRMTFLKPVSSAIAIGSGGPFGAEGPIIATGGALGSWLGQIFPVSSYERKIILAAGAASGMTAIFGTPFSAVVLAIELLLFEYRAKSFVPVALATVITATLRTTFFGNEAFFTMPPIQAPDLIALFTYLAFGVVIGVLAVGVTKSIYWIEDAFEKLPLHWMWWPAIGGLAVGIIGLIEPHALGVGYDNITLSLSGKISLAVAASIFVWKFLAWSIALGSGTSGGTLAPILTLGSAFGFMAGTALSLYIPELHTDISTMALIGMAGLFAGSSRALLATVIFALEGTKQPIGLVPLLGCCCISYLVSSLMMKNTIMTEKIARRGLTVPHEYYGNSEGKVASAKEAHH